MSTPPFPCQICVLTPTGRGAIATIAVFGADARSIVGQAFRSLGGVALDQRQPGTIVVGHFHNRSGTAEELVVGVIGVDEVEVNCHGGQAAIDAIVETLIAAGCERASADDFLRRKPSDRLTCDATLALMRAPTELTAAHLLAQQRGALRDAVIRVVQLIEAQQTDEAIAAIEQLLATADVGLHLTQPWRVVLAGRPNVGKSSLINAIVGYERAIVFDQPGTTRDVLTATTALDGWPIELSDTAGLRTSDDALEAAGIAQTRRRLEQAELVVAVFEAGERWTAKDAAFVAELPPSSRPPLLVFNKCDLASVNDENGSRPVGVLVSAKQRVGLDQLTAAIVARLVPTPIAIGEPLVFSDEQAAAVSEAAEQVRNNLLREAVSQLNAIC